jgi:putative transcriptional regulator
LIHAGSLLIAEPNLGDANFERAVVLLCETNPEGSFGLVINKPSEYILSELLESCLADHKVYVGGPVQKDTLHYIHCRPDLIKNSVALGNNIFWSGDFDNVTFNLMLGTLKETEIRFFIGYSGWGPNQLDDEIEQKSWFLTETTSGELFSLESQKYWREFLKNMGGKYKIIANAPLDPNLN